LALLFAGLSLRGAVDRHGFKGLLEIALRFIIALPLTWMLVVWAHRLFGIPPVSLMIPPWLRRPANPLLPQKKICQLAWVVIKAGFFP